MLFLGDGFNERDAVCMFYIYISTYMGKSQYRVAQCGSTVVIIQLGGLVLRYLPAYPSVGPGFQPSAGTLNFPSISKSKIVMQVLQIISGFFKLLISFLQNTISFLQTKDRIPTSPPTHCRDEIFGSTAFRSDSVAELHNRDHLILLSLH